MVSNFAKKLKEQFNTVKENMSKNNKQENVNSQNTNNKVNSISKAIVPTVQSTANEFKNFLANKIQTQNNNTNERRFDQYSVRNNSNKNYTIGLTSNNTRNTNVPTKELTEEQKQYLLKKYGNRSTDNIDEATKAKINEIVKENTPIREQAKQLTEEDIQESERLEKEFKKKYGNENVLTRTLKNVVQLPKAYEDDLDDMKDGYQFGDIVKTGGRILGDTAKVAGGTIADVGLGFGKGVLQTGEGLGKFAIGAKAQVNEWIGDTDEAKRLRKNLAEENDLLTNRIEKIQNKMNKYSASGQTLDEAAQTSGYMATLWATGEATSLMAGISNADKVIKAAEIADKVRNAVIIGNTAGHTLQETYIKQGTDVPSWSAWAKAVGSGYLEAKIESLGGFFGSSKIGNEVTLKLMNQVPSGVAKGLISIGMGANEEGLEEVAGYVGNQFLDRAIDLVSKLKGDKTKFTEEWNWEEMAQNYTSSFLSTLLTGGATAGYNIAEIKAQNNMTVKDAINNYGYSTEESLREEQNKKLLSNAQNKMQEILNDANESGMNKETIKEYLANKVEQNRIDEQEQYSLNDSIEQTTNEVETNLNETVRESAERIKDLFNSEEDKNRVVSTMEKFIELRNKHNTNGTLNILFNDKVNGNGKIIMNENGNRTILINPKSNKSFEFILSHELVHDIRNTKHYQGLQDIVLKFAQKSADFQEGVEQLTKEYTDFYKQNGYDLNKLDINEEVTADVVGTLLGDQNFINQLSIEKPSIFQRIRNWINQQIEIHKSGDKEATKFLYDVKNKFEKALRSQNKNSQDSEKYRVLYDKNNNPYVKVENDILENIPKKDWIKTVKEVFKQKYPNGIDMGFFNIGINAKSKNEFISSKYSQYLKDNDIDLYKSKFMMTDNIDEIVQNAYGVKNEPLKHKRSDSLKSFNHANIDVEIGSKFYNVEVVTGINTKNKELFYDIVNIHENKNRNTSISYSANAVTNKRKCF